MNSRLTLGLSRLNATVTIRRSCPLCVDPHSAAPLFCHGAAKCKTDILPLFDVLHEFSRLLQQCPEQFVRFDCILGKLTVLERVLIVLWRARSRRAPMHSTTLFAVTAGDLHGLPERVLAPQRWLASIGPVLRGCSSVICVICARSGLARPPLHLPLSLGSSANG